MVVPSPTAAYNSSYTNEFLVAKSAAVAEEFSFLKALPHGTLRGWCATMVEYLVDACGVHRGDGSKTGGPNRTILYGLQRTPVGQRTAIVGTSFEDIAPALVPFIVTNARDSVTVFVENASGLEELGVDVKPASCFSDEESWYNVIKEEKPDYALADHHISKYFPLGHIKSTRSDDEAFVDYFSKSEKWLKIAA